jgi:hypothetical protein
MSYLPYNSFEVENDITLDWFMKREDFEVNTLAEVEKLWMNKELSGARKVDENLTRRIIGNEQQRML